MGVRIIQKETDPVPCNVCDIDYLREHYEGTKTGICITCRKKKHPKDIEIIYYLLDAIYSSTHKQNKEMEWEVIRQSVKSLYTVVGTKEFIYNIRSFLVNSGLFDSEVEACMKTLLGK